MKLYTVPLAPNPMRVTLYLAERAALGMEIQLENVIVNTLKGQHREPEHLARNPFGTLPVLELDSGEYLTESLSIIDYLESAFPERATSSAHWNCGSLLIWPGGCTSRNHPSTTNRIRPGPLNC